MVSFVELYFYILIAIPIVTSGLIGTAMLGLMYDPADLVHLVLTTVRTNIVENSHVVKRLKQNTFNTKILEALVVLYEWQGPASKRFSRNKRGKIEALKKVTSKFSLFGN
jgi:Ribosome 60S biogenesis N-terminal